MSGTRLGAVLGVVALGISGLLWLNAAEGTAERARWRQHDMRRPRPAAITSEEGRTVLFDGTSLNAWRSANGGPARWEVVDGAMVTAPGSGPIQTRAEFGDVQLHVEWSAPSPPVGVGQDRGNSGVFLMGQYEIQVLDSYRAETYADGQAGALYGQYPPLFNASKPPGEWQTFDIAFRRPRFDASGKLVEPARLTVLHNGVLVQNNEELVGPTSWLKALPYFDTRKRGPLTLQDHDHPVRYRNIWVRELPERAEPTPDPSRPRPLPGLAHEILDQYAGQYYVNDKPDSPKATFRRDGDRFIVIFPFRPQPLLIEPISETEFDMPFTDGRFTFQKDAQGKVTGVHFRIGDGERKLRRAGP